MGGAPIITCPHPRQTKRLPLSSVLPILILRTQITSSLVWSLRVHSPLKGPSQDILRTCLGRSPFPLPTGCRASAYTGRSWELTQGSWASPSGLGTRASISAHLPPPACPLLPYFCLGSCPRVGLTGNKSHPQAALPPALQKALISAQAASSLPSRQVRHYL